MNFISAGFSVGDVVECVGLQDGNEAVVGKEGKIVCIRNDGEILSVEFGFNFPRGHKGINNKGASGRCWNFRWDDILIKIVPVVSNGPPPDFDGLF